MTSVTLEYPDQRSVAAMFGRVPAVGETITEGNGDRWHVREVRWDLKGLKAAPVLILVKAGW